MKKAWVLSYPLSAQQRLRSDWADAQADLSLRWAHSQFVGFVVRWLIFTVFGHTTDSGLKRDRGAVVSVLDFEYNCRLFDPLCQQTFE